MSDKRPDWWPQCPYERDRREWKEAGLCEGWDKAEKACWEAVQKHGVDPIIFEKRSRFLYEQARSVLDPGDGRVATIAAIILEIRGIMTGHTPESEHPYLLEKLTNWVYGARDHDHGRPDPATSEGG